MEVQSTTTSAASESTHGGLIEWMISILRRALGAPANEPMPENPTLIAPEASHDTEQDEIIAPGGYRIQRPGSGDATNSLENLLPDVRKGLDLLPPLPTVVLELLKEIQSAKSSAASVAQIAASDPSLAASLLRTVNSSAFGLANKITSVPQAVSYLGFDSVRSLVVQLRLERLLPKTNAKAAVESEDLWAHSLAVSYIAMALADRVPDVDRGFISTLGLMHDIGRLAILSQFPDRVQAMRAAEAIEGESRLAREARFFGADHAAIGAMLGNRWQLPADLTLAIRWHHAPGQAFEPSDPVSLRKAGYLIQVADQLAKYCFAYADDMEIAAPAEGALELLGLGNSMQELLDAKVRAAATQAILLADENSGRAIDVVRPFVNIRQGDAAAELARRVGPSQDSARIAIGDKGDELIDSAKQVLRFKGESPVQNISGDAVRLTALPNIAGVKWLQSTIAEQWEARSISARLCAPSRALLRALLPNLLEVDPAKVEDSMIDAALQWDGLHLRLAVRCPRLGFASRLPENVEPEAARRVVEAELANVLNMSWFEIECSADGETLLFTSH
jgi:putative nucleotidyltransferase with HDIG domain